MVEQRHYPDCPNFPPHSSTVQFPDCPTASAYQRCSTSSDQVAAFTSAVVANFRYFEPVSFAAVASAASTVGLAAAVACSTGLTNSKVKFSLGIAACFVTFMVITATLGFAELDPYLAVATAAQHSTSPCCSVGSFARPYFTASEAVPSLVTALLVGYSFGFDYLGGFDPK